MNYQSIAKGKRGFAFGFIFNALKRIENGGPSLCRGNAE